jgi:hypothetical protein
MQRLGEARDLFVGIGAEIDHAATTVLLAFAAVMRGDGAAATDLLEHAMPRLRRSGADRWTVEGLDSAAAAAMASGDAATAARLLAEGDGERAERHMRRYGIGLALIERVRAALGR